MSEGGVTSLKGGRVLIAAAIGIILLMGVGRMLTDLYVEWLWYGTTGYRAIFVRRFVWVWGTRLTVAAAVAALLIVNLRLVARTLGGIQIKRRFGNLEISEQLPTSYVNWAILITSAVVGLWAGGSVPESAGTAILVALRAGAWGVTEPVMGRDVGYYVFLLPLLRTGVTFLILLAFIVFTTAVGGYAATGAVRWGKDGVVMAEQARRHLGGVVAGFMILAAARLWLARDVLLLSGTSEVSGIFGFADAQARMPSFTLMAFVTILGAAAVGWGAWRNRLVPVAGGLGTVLVGALLATQFYPSLVQRFQVQPNELERETPYIEMNLEFTRLGFGLSELENRAFGYDPSQAVDWRVAAEQFDGLPVWTEASLLTTFRAVEAYRSYYDFEDAHVDRYRREDTGEVVPVALSVREIDPDGIDDPNWQNLHLRYVAGMGAVAVNVADRTPEGRPPMYLAAIPPEFRERSDPPESLRLTAPFVFFSAQRQRRYAAVAPGARVTGETDAGVATTELPRGIELSGTLRKLALAWYLGDPNLLFAAEVSDSTQLVLRRQVVERASEIAPFFRYPEAPYPVVVDGRIVWVLEGFTATRSFPLSRPQRWSGPPASYVRSSVKVTVDAITGETLFYALNEVDPFRNAIGNAFPELLRPVDEMPAALREHLRYPKSYLRLQAEVLEQYHQETAPIFHGQQELWERPAELLQTSDAVEYRPEYGIYRLSESEPETFNLTTVFVPAGRQNLAAVLVARLTEDGSPELVLFDVPVEDQAPGPRIVEALVEQDPQISQQFSLWRTGGSQVWTGHLHVVPVGSRLLFMEPVFLAAEADAIPELRRFVVSDGNRVSMEETLAEAIAALAGPSEAPPAEDDAERFRSLDTAEWPAEALDLLEEAESRLRSGDWEGFGAALERLRALLEGLSSGGNPG